MWTFAGGAVREDDEAYHRADADHRHQRLGLRVRRPCPNPGEGTGPRRALAIDRPMALTSRRTPHYSCVLATRRGRRYGQTGCGKTYTMTGGEDDVTMGIMPRCANDRSIFTPPTPSLPSPSNAIKMGEAPPSPAGAA